MFSVLAFAAATLLAASPLWAAEHIPPDINFDAWTRAHEQVERHRGLASQGGFDLRALGARNHPRKSNLWF
jgi:hypothetical protein